MGRVGHGGVCLEGNVRSPGATWSLATGSPSEWTTLPTTHPRSQKSKCRSPLELCFSRLCSALSLTC